MKKCFRCKATKPKTKFNVNRATKDGRDCYCKSCIKQYKARYRITQSGVINTIYLRQKRSSKHRGMLPPNYSREEFTVWLYDNGFYALWCQWAWSGYEINFAPSPDRLDDYKPYTLDNLRLVTWRDNRTKGCKDRKSGHNNKSSKAVMQYDDALLIAEYYSASQASRDTGAPQASISSCCRGESKTAGGYVWRFKTTQP